MLRLLFPATEGQVWEAEEAAASLGRRALVSEVAVWTAAAEGLCPNQPDPPSVHRAWVSPWRRLCQQPRTTQPGAVPPDKAERRRRLCQQQKLAPPGSAEVPHSPVKQRCAPEFRPPFLG